MHKSLNLSLNSDPPSDLIIKGLPYKQMTFSYNHQAKVSDLLSGKAPMVTNLLKLSTKTIIWLALAVPYGLMLGIRSIEYT